MVVHFYAGGSIDFRNAELVQFERIKKQLEDNLGRSSNEYHFIIDFVISNQQYDIILIKSDCFATIELKGYKGKVIGDENSGWYVTDDDGQKIAINSDKNPFIQCRNQRFTLMKYLNEKLKDIDNRFGEGIRNISAILCFEGTSYYDPSQMDFKLLQWLTITNEEELVERLKALNSREYILRDKEIDSLLNIMGVKKIGDKGIGGIASDSRKMLEMQDMARISEFIADTFSDSEFRLKGLQEHIPPEVAIRYLEDAIESGAIVESEDGLFSLVPSWSETLQPIETTTEADEEMADQLIDSSFTLRPAKMKEGGQYLGIYRGTKYHFNYNGEVWWQKSGQYPKIKANFSNKNILEKILSYKPQGGNFRITESGDILTKLFTQERGYVPIYIGSFSGKIELDGLRWNEEQIQPGQLWPGLYDGTNFSVNTNEGLFIKVNGMKVYAKTGHEKLVKNVLAFNAAQGGGRFVINESGAIIVLLHKSPFPERIRLQMDMLSSEEKNIIDIRSSLDMDGRVPIYVGKFDGNIQFKPVFDINRPWTDEEDEAFLKRLVG